MKTKRLTESAMLLALAIVLELDAAECTSPHDAEIAASAPGG